MDSLTCHRLGGLEGWGGDEPVLSVLSVRSTPTRLLDRMSSSTDAPPKLVESVAGYRHHATAGVSDFVLLPPPPYPRYGLITEIKYNHERYCLHSHEKP